MKKLIFTLTLLCFGLFAQAQIPSYVPTNGLVGWWPFNGNANDESGNGNHGTVNGATLAADRFGNSGKAYSFNNSSIIIPHSTSISTSNFTISAWVKLGTFNGNGFEVLTKGCDLNENYEFLVYGSNVDSGAVETAIKFTDGSRSGTGGSGIPNNCPKKLNSNIWSFITASYDINSGFLRTYINGIPNCIDFLNRVPQQNSSPITIGREPCFNGREYFGLLDDIAIYNRALSATEVQQLYLGNSGNSASISTVPGKINYQGVAVGANGKPIKNGSVGLRLSVLDSTLNGGVLYTETKTVTTDASGLFATHLGGGTVTAGTFASIPWANGNDKFLKVEMDAQGGSNYQNMGTTQLVSVPYALHAGTAQSANTLRDSSGNAYQIKTVNGQPTLVAAPGSGSSSNPGSFACGQSVTYAGESYPTVQIGTQCWFQKNLNVGTMILGANDQTNNSTLEKYCYNNDTANCSIYGGLYQWAEAVQYQNGASNYAFLSTPFTGNVRGICPTGWHLPSDAEWGSLETLLGGSSVAGGALKSTSGLWNSPNTGASNSSGFSALPGGYRHTPAVYSELGNLSFFWSALETSNANSVNRDLANNGSSIVLRNNVKEYGFSVRCIKD